VDRSGRRFLLGVLGAGLMAVLYACGQVGGSGQCGGAADSGSCIKIASIIPKYVAGGGNTSDVDAFQDICKIDANTGEITVEPFTDHNATVTLRNDPLPGAPTDTTNDVTITQYTLTYTLNNCPFTASSGNCPALATQTVTPGQTILIPANSSVTYDLKFVDIAKKQEYASKVGDDTFPLTANVLQSHTLAAYEYPSYTVTYRFSGTDIFNNKIDLTGFSEFTIGDYDNCQQ
jgi:hypothetical protein